MAPHSMTMTMVGASMLWVGWFGFNVGSNLEANGGAALAMINTFIATAGAILAWVVIDMHACAARPRCWVRSRAWWRVSSRSPRPAGFAGPVGAIVLGAVAASVCYFFVAVVKHRLGYDDSLDVFGIHGIGGIVGAIGTGIVEFGQPAAGSAMAMLTMGGQVMVQIQGGAGHHRLVGHRVLRRSTRWST